MYDSKYDFKKPEQLLWYFISLGEVKFDFHLVQFFPNKTSPFKAKRQIKAQGRVGQSLIKQTQG